MSGCQETGSEYQTLDKQDENSDYAHSDQCFKVLLSGLSSIYIVVNRDARFLEERISNVHIDLKK